MILEQERAQIVAWALQGLERLKRNKGYTEPECHKKLVAQMMMRNNSVYYFLAQDPRLRFGKAARAGTRTTMQDLHQAYWSFLAGSGKAKAVPPQAFTAMMDKLSHSFGFRRCPNQAGPVEYEFITIMTPARTRQAA
jgi:hypothetical protein